MKIERTRIFQIRHDLANIVNYPKPPFYAFEKSFNSLSGWCFMIDILVFFFPTPLDFQKIVKFVSKSCETIIF